MKYIFTLMPIEYRNTVFSTEAARMWCKEHFDCEVVNKDNKIFKVKPNEFFSFRDYFLYMYDLFKDSFEKIKDGDMLFFLDMCTPGVEIFEYIRKMEHIKLEMRGFFAAGVTDTYDPVSVNDVRVYHTEQGWLDMFDKVYVGSNYFRNHLYGSFRIHSDDKVIVSGDPLNIDAIKVQERSGDQIIFPSRLSYDKGYDIIERLIADGYDIKVTHKMNLSKQEYYDLLLKAKLVILPARAENFGVSAMEALAANVPIFVPNGFSYVDYVPREYRYPNDIEYKYIKEFLDMRLKNDIRINTRCIAEQFDWRRVFKLWLE